MRRVAQIASLLLISGVAFAAVVQEGGIKGQKGPGALGNFSRILAAEIAAHLDREGSPQTSDKLRTEPR